MPTSDSSGVRRAHQRLASAEESGGVKRTASLKLPTEDAELELEAAGHDAQCKRQKMETDWLRQVGQLVPAQCGRICWPGTLCIVVVGRRHIRSCMSASLHVTLPDASLQTVAEASYNCMLVTCSCACVVTRLKPWQALEDERSDRRKEVDELRQRLADLQAESAEEAASMNAQLQTVQQQADSMLHRADELQASATSCCT